MINMSYQKVVKYAVYDRMNGMGLMCLLRNGIRIRDVNGLLLDAGQHS